MHFTRCAFVHNARKNPRLHDIVLHDLRMSKVELWCPPVQRSFAPVQEERARVLFVGEPAQQHLVVPNDIVQVANVGDAMMQLRNRRFSVLVVQANIATDSEVRRLARLDPEMYLLVAAPEAALTHVGPLVRDWKADGVVRMPLNRNEISSAVERASRVGSRVADCVRLYELCRSLFGTLKQRDLVRTVLDVAPRVVASDSAALFLVGTFCESPAAFECHTTEIPGPEIRCLLAEVTGLMSRRGAMLSDEDIDQDRKFDSGWRWLACPLFSADALGGAVVFLRRAESDPFSPRERQAASTFAMTAANALENAHDYRELETKVLALTRERHRSVSREAVAIAKNLGGAVAHEVTNAMSAVTTNVDALAAAAQDQELWQVAKEAAEYLLHQGEPTGQRLASRIMDAGGVRNADGLVTEIAAMIDECLDGVRRVSEMARGLNAAFHLPPAAPQSTFDATDMMRAPVVTSAAVNRPVLFQLQFAPALVAARPDVEQALGHVISFLDSSAHRGGPGPRSLSGMTPLVIRVEERLGACAVTVDDPTPASETELQSLLTPRLRVSPDNVFRFDASLSFAHALLARNGLDLWVEARQGGGVSFVISSASAA
jgi:hypothetical protein